MYIGLHTYYNGKNKKKRQRKLELIFKNCLSPDCILKLKYMKLKSLVIVDNNATVNEKSDFAHTAHHARRVFAASRLKHFILESFNLCFKANLPTTLEISNTMF